MSLAADVAVEPATVGRPRTEPTSATNGAAMVSVGRSATPRFGLRTADVNVKQQQVTAPSRPMPPAISGMRRDRVCPDHQRRLRRHALRHS